MSTLIIIIQIIIALGIFNVWILRFGRSSAWRGGTATNMKEEFEAYGLPRWVMILTGFLKLLFAVLLVAGIWEPVLARVAGIGIALLMAGAVAMHVKVKDPARKSLPALTLLVLSLAVALWY